MKENRGDNGRNKMKKIACVTAVFVGTALILAGCCSIVHGTRQKIGVSSSPTGAKVFVNDVPMGTTPAALDLDRDGTHKVRIELDGYEPYEMVITRSVSGWVWGNILFGGLIGLAIDAIDGALYQLTPEQVSAQLQKGADNTLQINMIKGPPKTGTKIGQMDRTPAEQLKELKDLKDRGILTDQEYELKRTPLVNQLSPVQEDDDTPVSVPEVENPPPAPTTTAASSDDPFAKYDKALEQVDKKAESR